MVMNWFRKHTKRIMVVIILVVMVVFVGGQALTSILKNIREGDKDYAYYRAHGEQKKLSTADSRNAHQDLTILRAFGAPIVAEAILTNPNPQTSQVFGPPHHVVVLAANALIFSDNQVRQNYRNFIAREARQAAVSPEALEAAFANIEAIVTSEEQLSFRLFSLLVKEAENAGIAATIDQVALLREIRGQVYQQRPNMLAPLSEVISGTAGTSERLNVALGHYLAVMRYLHIASQGAVSETQLRHVMRDTLQAGTVAGSFVTFSGSIFSSKVPEITDEQIAEQFEQYKSIGAGSINDDNPFGFGYKLPDRVQVEYLSIPLDKAEAIVTAEMRAKSALEQEETIRAFWKANQLRFRQTGEDQQPIDPPYDQVATQTRQMWKSEEARRRAEQVLTEAKQLAKQQAQIDEKGNITSSADYAALAQQLSTDALPVTHAATDYLSFNAAQAYENFQRTYRLRNGIPEAALLDALFASEPLRERPPSPLDDAPLKLNEDFGPLVAFGPFREQEAVYLVRIIGADKTREPISLADDGTQGPAESAAPDAEKSALRDAVIADIKRREALVRADKAARDFARDAGIDGWETTLKAANTDLSELAGYEEPLIVETIDDLRRQLGADTRGMSRQMQVLQLDNRRLLRDALKLAQERAGTETTELAVLLDEPANRCVVFETLNVPNANEQDYLDMRALAAHEWVRREQTLAALTLLNPENIAKRLDFKFIEAPTEEPASEEE